MDTIKNICELPIIFLKRGDVSFKKLLLDSGYRDQVDNISIDILKAYLCDKSDLVDSWFILSENKRTLEGWYLKETSDGKYEVGYFPNEERLIISNKISACAEFILREIKSIAG